MESAAVAVTLAARDTASAAPAAAAAAQDV